MSSLKLAVIAGGSALGVIIVLILACCIWRSCASEDEEDESDDEEDLEDPVETKSVRCSEVAALEVAVQVELPRKSPLIFWPKRKKDRPKGHDLVIEPDVRSSLWTHWTASLQSAKSCETVSGNRTSRSTMSEWEPSPSD